MKSIVWLASYPKSGNTWLRVFLANYIFNRTEPIPINKVHQLGMGDAITKAYNRVAKGPFDPSNPQQCAKLRTAVLQGIVNNRADVNFVKTHCNNGSVCGNKLIPQTLTRSAIYILRNPLDLVISYANHYHQSLDRTIESSTQRDHMILGDNNSVCQFVGHWSAHVRSWAESCEFPVLVLRYEDLQGNPSDTFSRVVQHIGLPFDKERLSRAIGFSNFDEMRRQENQNGFIEKSKNQERFFRSGTVGQWRSALSAEQINRIRSEHNKVMDKYGYG